MNALSLFRCLGDPTRMEVVRCLGAGGPRTVGELVERTGQEQTNVSHHLAQLRACGFVVSEQEGRHVRYTLAHPKLVAFLEEADELAEHIGCMDAQACIEAGCC